jgi:hypothetical protein
MRPFTHLQQVGLLLSLFFIYELGGSREVPWNDGKQIHQVAESIVQRRAIDIPMPSGVRREGKNYAAHPLLPSAVHIPGARIQKAVARRWPGAEMIARALGSHLAPAVLGALACLLFALLCHDLGASPLAAQLGALTLGLGTMVAIYARSPWSEIVQTSAFLGFFLWLLRVCRAPSGRAAFYTGLWAGLLINAKLIFVVSLPGALGFALWQLWRQRPRAELLKLVGWAMLGFLPCFVVALAYNHARTGSITGTGYAMGGAGRVFAENPLVGLWGLLFSPGKSVFLYCPPLVAGALALPWALRSRDRAWFWALLATALPPVYVYTRYVFWSGDWCWGPRYILFVVPPLLVPAVLAFDRALQVRRRVAVLAASLVLASGIAVQVIGASFYWDHFIRISQEATTHWLGSPNRSGAVSRDRGGMCDPCFEDFYSFNWLPPFSPIEGHVWLLRHVPFDHDWLRAEQDAPWHRYTKLKLTIAGFYPRARVDWWYLDFRKKFPFAGHVLLSSMLAGLSLALTLWWLGGRRPSAARPRTVSLPHVPLEATDG